MAKKKPYRKGFTIIEVSLVLAVSGVLLIGIIASTNGVIARHRYSDSVQNVTEQLRSIYSQVSNPQGNSDAGGNTNTAFYGKLIAFGDTDEDGASVIRTYTVIGRAEANAAKESSAAVADLTSSGAALRIDTNSEASYTAPWSTRIESSGADSDNSNNIFTGSVLILYSANGGVIHTYYTPEVYRLGDNFNKVVGATPQSVNICIDSPDRTSAASLRRNIRIAADGRNSSAIELIDVDSEDNQCQ